jgi:hypothetical protein
MIQSYYKSPWLPKHVIVADLINTQPFSSCCGSMFYTNNKRKYNSKGIALRDGKHFEEGQKGSNFTKHVETPDGVITLTLRTVW